MNLRQALLASQLNLDYPLLSDFWPHGKVAMEYGAFFPDRGFVDSVVERKRALGNDFAFGVLVTEDIGDPSVMDNPSFPDRRAHLLRILEVADFVWSLVPITDYSRFVQTVRGTGYRFSVRPDTNRVEAP